MGGDSHLGSNRPSNRVTAVSSISDGALKNLQDKNEHGFHTRLRVGADARINDTTNVKLLVTAQGQNGVDTSHEMVGSKGIQHSRVEELIPRIVFICSIVFLYLSFDPHKAMVVTNGINNNSGVVYK